MSRKTKTQEQPTAATGEPMPNCFRIACASVTRALIGPRTIKTGLTESEALAHCDREDTRKPGVYFDVYDYMKGTKP
jgi:hypothetical protein